MSEAGTQSELARDSNSGDGNPTHGGRALALRIGLTATALVIWFGTQAWIGTRSLPASGIGDGLQAATAPVNSYLLTHPAVANALLLVSSGIVDVLGIFLLSKWIFGASLRPFLGLVIVLGLRQVMQACVALPAPPNAIWHNPGFPSLFVTYGVAHDYFFSGHTAIAVLGAGELARVGRPWLTVFAVGLVLFEIFAVLALRAHYTMDVFTGAMSALYAMHVAGRLVVDTKHDHRG